MKRTSCKIRPVRQWASFGFAAFTVFLLAISSMPSAAQKAAGWRVELEEGKTARSTLTINNRCAAPHLFRIKSGVKYLRFEQPVDSVLLEASSSRELGVRFDATGLRNKTYKGVVIIECLDCKQDPGCKQDRDELAVEMIVMKATVAVVSKPQSDEGSFTLTRLKDGFSAQYIFSQKTILTELHRRGNRSVVSVREASLGGILNMEIPPESPSFSNEEAFKNAGKFVVEDGFQRAALKEQVLLLTALARSSQMIARELEGKESGLTLVAVQALPKFLGMRLERSGVNDTAGRIVIGRDDGRCFGACGPGCGWCTCGFGFCACEVNRFCIWHDTCCGAWNELVNCTRCLLYCWTC